MPRMLHGQTLSLEDAQAAIANVAAMAAAFPGPVAIAAPRRLTDYGYLFPDLHNDPANLLVQGASTTAGLQSLGESMVKGAQREGTNPRIPSVYTYLGQFIDHDITLELVSDTFFPSPDGAPHLENPALLEVAAILERVKNMRTATLDLDSVYDSPAPFDTADPNQMLIGHVTPEGHPVPGKGVANDLPRTGRDANKVWDRSARIGDGRNDENLIIAQLHLAFLKAHNALVQKKQYTFEEGRRDLSRLYQWIVIHDFLVKVAGQAAVDSALAGNRFYNPPSHAFFMPLEFVVAAYRFGHSMIRPVYDFNQNFGQEAIQLAIAPFDLLFTFTALSGNLGDFDTLPENWVIQWERFVDPAPNPTMLINTRLAPPLDTLPDIEGNPMAGLMGRLAVRNLLRGYRFRLPTGQAMAARMGIPPLTPQEILSVAAGNPDMEAALTANNFHERTPLWFYILAEAQLLPGESGQRLGAVGGTIVAEVLVELIRRSAHSILEPGLNWSPAQLGLPELEVESPTIKDLLKLAGVL